MQLGHIRMPLFMAYLIAICFKANLSSRDFRKYIRPTIQPSLPTSMCPSCSRAIQPPKGTASIHNGFHFSFTTVRITFNSRPVSSQLFCIHCLFLCPGKITSSRCYFSPTFETFSWWPVIVSRLNNWPHHRPRLTEVLSPLGRNLSENVQRYGWNKHRVWTEGSVHSRMFISRWV